MNHPKPRLLSGDTPTGKLHLGHWVGSLETRLALQESYECYFIIANVHAFTTRAEHPTEIRQNTLDIALDYLAVGFDPKQSSIFIQSEVPAIAELTWFFSMLLSFPRVMRNPTIKDEIRNKNLGDNYPFGFLLYPVGQIADVLAFRPELVPVGEDQVAHLEMARECARRFNQLYCGVDPQTEDKDYVAKGGLFPIIQPKLSRVKRLVGTGAPNSDGVLPKMSKSLNNAIYLSDDADSIAKKIRGMYTDPKRLRASDPGSTENNPLWIFHEAFNPDKKWVEEAEIQYRQGQIGDKVCKEKLVEILVALTQPMRERRRLYENDPGEVLKILQQGTEQANELAEDTLIKAKTAMKQDYFKRQLKLSSLP
ncbi:tryptophanyl-tRNA synthetase [Candidatus Rickettsiella viridis]|uniref:Tryptophan--tRNA ligase n=1 Tax=Candidatus Rickettsiella viridis TaxID=676208 RepID=A0A2Z5UUN9_9COXI|nr:tryptophan--tRNA ligase [Candidatus Rickettsiella viridis]BBB14660.1 tryptophanyl-tRNA synthetase [Candidatus Rickettsiella viridis]